MPRSAVSGTARWESSGQGSPPQPLPQPPAWRARLETAAGDGAGDIDPEPDRHTGTPWRTHLHAAAVDRCGSRCAPCPSASPQTCPAAMSLRPACPKPASPARRRCVPSRQHLPAGRAPPNSAGHHRRQLAASRPRGRGRHSWHEGDHLAPSHRRAPARIPRRPWADCKTTADMSAPSDLICASPTDPHGTASPGEAGWFGRVNLAGSRAQRGWRHGRTRLLHQRSPCSRATCRTSGRPLRAGVAGGGARWARRL